MKEPDTMKKMRSVNLVWVWLALALGIFALGAPFVAFLHFFGGHYIVAAGLSVTLASYYTMIVAKLRSRSDG